MIFLGIRPIVVQPSAACYPPKYRNPPTGIDCIDTNGGWKISKPTRHTQHTMSLGSTVYVKLCGRT